MVRKMKNSCLVYTRFDKCALLFLLNGGDLLNKRLDLVMFFIYLFIF